MPSCRAMIGERRCSSIRLPWWGDASLREREDRVPASVEADLIVLMKKARENIDPLKSFVDEQQ